ncbi:hypothetical protein COB72_02600 [bacterium]|nr:MAG: hypothetical protein COB72_02600 [bacterium]
MAIFLSSSVQEPIADPSSIITTANAASDVAQILYGLSIRGVRAKAVESYTKRKDRFLILLESPTPIQHQIANESIAGIWDAILEDYQRAITFDGHCFFCQYDVSNLPKPTTCPECGHNLDAHAARRAMRDQQKL